MSNDAEDSVNAELTSGTVTLKEHVAGDINGDGSFNIVDLITLQNWMLNIPDTEITDTDAVDFLRDNKLNILDFCLMKQALIDKITNYVEPDEVPA